MKKIILILALLVSANAGMCEFHSKYAIKYVKKANLESEYGTSEQRRFYLKAALDSFLDASASCPEGMQEMIELSIKRIKEVY